MTLTASFIILDIVARSALVHRGQISVVGPLAGFYIYVTISALDLLIRDVKLVREKDAALRHDQPSIRYDPRSPQQTVQHHQSRDCNRQASHQITCSLPRLSKNYD